MGENFPHSSNQTKINFLLAFLILFAPNTAVATSTQIAQPALVYSTTTSEAIVRAYAAKYAVLGDELYGTLKCESNLRSNAVGDHGTSYGVAQIHLPAHTDITKSQALDPFWAIDWAAREFSLGHQTMWTCWRNLYGGTSG